MNEIFWKENCWLSNIDLKIRRGSTGKQRVFHIFLFECGSYQRERIVSLPFSLHVFILKDLGIPKGHFLRSTCLGHEQDLEHVQDMNRVGMGGTLDLQFYMHFMERGEIDILSNWNNNVHINCDIIKENGGE